MGHPSSIQSLREEFPALALTVGFASPKDRAHLADLLLLWLEINRARNAAESMIAAARITWWREALDNNKSEGVPLAERLLASHRDLTPVSLMLQNIIGITLDAAPDSEHQIAHAVGDMLAAMLHPNTDEAANDIAHTLLALRSAMGGNPISSDLLSHLYQADILISFKLMAWLAERPASLNYPDANPLLPLKMMVRAARL